MENTQPTKEKNDTAAILYGFCVTVQEDKNEPTFEVYGNPTPRAILALAEDVVSRINGIVMNNMDDQLNIIVARLNEMKIKMDNSAGSTEAIVALLGKMVKTSDTDTISPNINDNYSSLNKKI